MPNKLAAAAAELLRSAGFVEQPDGSWQPADAITQKRALCDDIALPKDVAEVLNTSIFGLANMRHRGTGPRYIKRGKYVLYRWSDVREYLETNSRRCTSERNPRTREVSA
jgi:hypothetical protein